MAASTVRPWPCAVALFLLAACAGVALRPAPPVLTLYGIRGIELRQQDARMSLRFEASNPNDFELEVGGVEFDVTVEGINVASARTIAAFRLPRMGSAFVDVDIASPFDRLVAASRAAVGRRADKVRYEITGTAVVADLRIPFRRSGEVAMPMLRLLGRL